MVSRFLAAAVIGGCLIHAPCGSAGGFDPIAWRGRAELLATTDPYPGYAATRSDEVLRADLRAETSTRLGAGTKIGVSATLGAHAFAHFSESRQAWGEFGVSARRAGTRIVGWARLEPRRLKFPSEPIDARFQRRSWGAGIRRELPGGLLAKADLDLERDNFVPLFNARDARGRRLDGALEWSARPGLSLEGSVTLDRSDAASDKYDYRDHGGGGGVTRDFGTWRIGGSLRSGTRRYTHAILGDSNFRRRDRWLELETAWTRTLSPDLALTVGAALRDQTSSRQDRTYSVGSLRIGLTWESTP
ncbi:MAG: hypothetical protein AAB011_05195 [Candidatus Eisenbacteria bacterium]